MEILSSTKLDIWRNDMIFISQSLNISSAQVTLRHETKYVREKSNWLI